LSADPHGNTSGNLDSAEPPGRGGGLGKEARDARLRTVYRWAVYIVQRAILACRGDFAYNNTQAKVRAGIEEVKALEINDRNSPHFEF
jgi:hypothetical protein